jgi:hypothetical protein
VIKTRLMVQEKAAAGGAAPRYRGMVHGITTIFREEGFMALYKGLLPRILRVPPGMVRPPSNHTRKIVEESCLCSRGIQSPSSCASLLALLPPRESMNMLAL